MVVQSHFSIMIMFDHLDSFKLNLPWACEGAANRPGEESLGFRTGKQPVQAINRDHDMTNKKQKMHYYKGNPSKFP